MFNYIILIYEKSKDQCFHHKRKDHQQSFISEQLLKQANNLGLKC